MRLIHVLSAARSLLKAKLLGIQTPLAVSFNLTTRCNQRCLYCGVWKKRVPEISASEVIPALEVFHQLGTCWVSFTGGEPLLRDDLGELVQHAKEKGFCVSVSSNGALVPSKITQLKPVDDLKLSFDGPPQVHDHLRGEGSFDKVMLAIESCNQNNIKPSLQCVLSAHNLESIESVLETAKKLDVKVLFQPATSELLWSKEMNPQAPPVEQYRQTIMKLIDAKKGGAPVRNSLPGLRHIYHWPTPTKMPCSAGILNCELLPDGSLLTCSRFENGETHRLKTELRADLKNLPVFSDCKQCWSCALVEFNLIASFNFQALINSIKNF